MSAKGTNRLAFLELAGSPHDIGVALGRFGRDAVHGHLLASDSWRELSARRDDPRLGKMAEIVRDRFPRCWAELQGLAEGLQLPFEDAFLWNCRGDIWPMAPDGCTTVQLPGKPHVIAHNEDGDPGFAGHCALAHVAGDEGDHFTTFVYPGSLPGHSFAATSAGLVQTVNNIRPRTGGVGVPRMILTRAVLDAATLDSALDLLRGAPRAGAFHLTLAQAGDERLLSVEFSARGISVKELDCPRLHANHLLDLQAEIDDQIVTGSSGSRQEKGDQLVATLENGGESDALAILWNGDDPQFPILRTDPRDPDAENTLATALFSVGADKVRWAVYDAARKPARFEIGDKLVPIPREPEEA